MRAFLCVAQVEQKNATNTGGGACGVADGSQDDSALICPD